MTQQLKTALFLTGAAARISQEVALIDKLIEKRGLEINKHETYLAGFSSGALNLAAINACFDESIPYSWDNYKNDLLFKIKTDDIFNKSKKLPFDTKPLRLLIESFLERVNFSTLADFQFHAQILTFSLRKLRTVWSYSRNENDASVHLADLLMATSAIPVVFPAQKIGANSDLQDAKYKGRFTDGGTVGTFKNFKKNMGKFIEENGVFDKMYIISPMRDVSNADFDEINASIPNNDLFNLDIKDFLLLKEFVGFISMNGFDLFIKSLWRYCIRYAPPAKEIYVCIPALEHNFPLLNFDLQEAQYHAVCDWADANPEQLTIPLEEFVKDYAETDTAKLLAKFKGSKLISLMQQQGFPFRKL